MARTLYVLYNANGTAFGKLSYGYKKLTSSSAKPVCAACELTHGGLRLDENEAWKMAKAQIEKEGGLEVKQLHRDELGAEVSPLTFLSMCLGEYNRNYDLPRTMNLMLRAGEEIRRAGGRTVSFSHFWGRR